MRDTSCDTGPVPGIEIVEKCKGFTLACTGYAHVVTRLSKVVRLNKVAG